MVLRELQKTEVQRHTYDLRNRSQRQGFPWQPQLGRATRGRGAPLEKRRFAAIQGIDGVRHQPPPADNGYAVAEQPEGALGAAALYHAAEVPRLGRVRRGARERCDKGIQQASQVSEMVLGWLLLVLF